MRKLSNFTLLSLVLVPTLVCGQTVTVLRDLDAQGRVTLSREELVQLLTNANMRRVTTKGNTQSWKNDPGGSFIISSDNRDRGGQASTAPGKWHISDDGRYCVLISWKTIEAEEWCRYIVKAGGDYYGAKSDKSATEKVYKLEVLK